MDNEVKWNAHLDPTPVKTKATTVWCASARYHAQDRAFAGDALTMNQITTTNMTHTRKHINITDRYDHAINKCASEHRLNHLLALVEEVEKDAEQEQQAEWRRLFGELQQSIKEAFNPNKYAA